ncbi:MAG: VWA domain-containing protein [Gammaproteobacteria bacterium]|nr:VWA domain-containing protein [Gammaproteobacteria bacterium]
MKLNNRISIFIVALLIIIGLGGCTNETPPQRSKAVFMLLDTSGTYTEELVKAQKIINYLLARLDRGDTLAIGRIDSGSFSEKDIVAKVTFDARPSKSNEQKRAFKRDIDKFITHVKSSPYTDISGGILQASEYLNETGAQEKYILIFSDLKEDLVKGHVRNFAIPLADINVVALNVTKLRSDNVDPRKYMDRLSDWSAKVANGGGIWTVVNDLDRLESLIKS